MSRSEKAACTPVSLNPLGFNESAQIPYGLKPKHVRLAMQEFLDFLGFINNQLHTKDLDRLESFMMRANFSSMVGEFMVSTLPKHCKSIVRNKYHNGHPDLLPKGKFEGNSTLHGRDGIEIKGSRHPRGWQGHNAEDVWLMVFCFDSNTSRDVSMEIEPRPFRFIKVVGARLEKSDWQFSGRSATSRRTITASVRRSGFEKMEANWIYRSG